MAEDKDVFTKAFNFGGPAEFSSGGKDPANDDSFKQIYGPRMAAVAERLKREGRGEVNKPPEPTAEEKAAAIIAAAEAEAEAIREKARKEGFEAGCVEGREKFTRAAERLTRVAVEIAAVKPRLVEEVEEEVVALVCAVAERILGPLVCQKPECVLHVVKRALAAISDRETVTVRVAPADLQMLMEGRSSILEGVDGVRNLTFTDDHSIQPGGCIVETGSTEIDARLKTQLDEIVRALEEI